LTHAIMARGVALVLILDLIISLYPRRCSSGKAELG
jgi:hypothetical protein